MIQRISKNNFISFNKKDDKYNQYGLQKSLKDPNNPSNKNNTRDEFIKNKEDDNRNKLSPILALSLGFTALFYGILKKSNII